MARPRWATRIENDFRLGIIRDTHRTGIPPGGVYDAQNMLVHRPGVAFRRAGTRAITFDAPTGSGLIAVSAPYIPIVGQQIIIVTDGFHVYEVDTGSAIDHGTLTGFTNIIDPPTLFVGGLQNVLVFCDSTGNKTPWFYTGGDTVQQFLGGGYTATDYVLTISGTPTGGSFKLAAQDLTSGFSYLTAAIAYNASAANVEAALEAAAPETFASSGGPLPGSTVTINVPVDWAVSYVPASASGVNLTGGTNPGGQITISGGESLNVPDAIHSCTHLEHLVLANSTTNPNRVWFGPIINPTTTPWNMTESWIDNDESVSAITSLSGQLLIFSYDGMWRITGSEPPPDTDFELKRMGSIGCTDARSIAIWGSQCVFANTSSVFVTTGVGYTNLMEGRISEYYQALFLDYDPSTWTISAGVWADRFLFLSVLDDTDTLVEAFICDLPNRAWTRHTAPKARMYANSSSGRKELYAADPSATYGLGLSGVVDPVSDNQRVDADGATVLPTLETRPLTAGIGLKAFGDSEVIYRLRDDDGDNPTLAVNVAAGIDAPVFVAAPESPLAETAGATGLYRRRITVSKDTEAVSFQLIQSNASTFTEIYGIEWSERPYGPQAEGE